jgi:hypothetical protein
MSFSARRGRDQARVARPVARRGGGAAAARRRRGGGAAAARRWRGGGAAPARYKKEERKRDTAREATLAALSSV